MKIVRQFGRLIMRGLRGQSLFLGVAVGASLLVAGYLIFAHERGPGGDPPEGVSKLTLDDIPIDEFDGRRSYDYLKQVCAIGPRPSGSAGMVAQQKLLADF